MSHRAGTVRRHRRAGAVALTMSIALSAVGVACSGGGDGDSSGRVRSPDERFTDAEWDYGASVTRGIEGVTYQPDVVIPGGGAESIVGVSGDGITWTIDGDAAEADDLAVGKVLLATNRAAGRILGVESVGDDVAVTIGPAELTDFIRDIDTSFDGPIDPNLIQVRSAPTLPSSADLAPTDTGMDDGPANIRAAPAQEIIPPADGFPTDRGTLPPPVEVPVPFTLPDSGMRTFPLHGSDGSYGIELAYDRNGLKFRGSARVYVQKPTVRFDLLIVKGKIINAEASLSGLAGLRVDMDAATESGLAGNINKVIDLPLDISMPIVGEFPFSVNFGQSLKISTAFSAKQSSLNFVGDYAFTGSLRMGYSDGRFGAGAPTSLSVKRSLLQSTSGVSLGVTGFVFAHKLKMTVGIGGFGFVVGPYASLTSAVGVTNGSDLGIVKCKGATLDLDMAFGIGYVMPQPVVKVINFFLRSLNLGEIKPSGGTDVQKLHLATLQGYAPKVKVCEGAV